MNTISAINKISFKGNTLNNNQTQVQAQAPVPEIKNDTVELSTKNKTGLIDKIKANKKVLIPVAIGLAAIAGGLIFAIKTGKISFKGKIEQQAAEAISGNGKIEQQAAGILSESERIKQQAAEIEQRAAGILGENEKILKNSEEIKVEAQKQYDEVMKILKKEKEEGFKDVVDKSGKTIKRFVDDTSTKGARKIMDELDGDKILRKTYFNPDNLEISRIDKGITQNADGTDYIAEKFIYSDGEPFEFIKDYKWNPDVTESWAENFIYRGGKLSEFIKDHKLNPDGTVSQAENFSYSDGKLYGFKKDYKFNPGGTVSWEEDFKYSDGKLSGFIKDHKFNPDRTESWAEKFVRNREGKLEKVDPPTV